MIRKFRSALGLWWADQPLTKKGLVVVGIPIVALLGSVISSYAFERAVVQSDTAVMQHIRLRTILGRLDLEAGRAETQLIHYLLLGNDGLRGGYIDRRRAIRELLAQLTPVDADDGPQLAVLKPLLGEQIERMDRVFAEGVLSTDKEPIAAVHVGTDAIHEYVEAWLTTEEEELAELTARRDAVGKTRAIQAMLFLIIGIMGGSLAAVLFSSGITGRVRRLEENTRLLAQRSALRPFPPGRDEVGRVGQSLLDAEALLAQAENELRKSETGLRRALQDAEQARSRAEEANRAKSQFFSRTSHELRTPLNAIL
ncbi:MAG TPA: hypothetical protein VGK54_15620, partial [Chloroflexota bacterium]